MPPTPSPTPSPAEDVWRQETIEQLRDKVAISPYQPRSKVPGTEHLQNEDPQPTPYTFKYLRELIFIMWLIYSDEDKSLRRRLKTISKKARYVTRVGLLDQASLNPRVPTNTSDPASYSSSSQHRRPNTLVVPKLDPEHFDMLIACARILDDRWLNSHPKLAGVMTSEEISLAPSRVVTMRDILHALAPHYVFPDDMPWAGVPLDTDLNVSEEDLDRYCAHVCNSFEGTGRLEKAGRGD